MRDNSSGRVVFFAVPIALQAFFAEDGAVVVRLTIGLPATGRRIRGREAATALTEMLWVRAPTRCSCAKRSKRTTGSWRVCQRMPVPAVST